MARVVFFFAEETLQFESCSVHSPSFASMGMPFQEVKLIDCFLCVCQSGCIDTSINFEMRIENRRSEHCFSCALIGHRAVDAVEANK